MAPEFVPAWKWRCPRADGDIELRTAGRTVRLERGAASKVWVRDNPTRDNPSHRCGFLSHLTSRPSRR